MKDKIKIQCYKNGELYKEIEEENIIILSEFSRGEMLSHLGICETIMLMLQLSLEYDRFLKIAKDEFHIPENEVSLLIKKTKLDMVEKR